MSLLTLSCLPCNDAIVSSFLDPHGPVAAAQKTYLIWVLRITIIAVLPVLILVPSFLWYYRYKNTKARYTPQWEFSLALEAVMWGLPLAIVLVLSTLVWIYTRDLDPYKPIDPHIAPLKVQVVGLNWKWLFLYPELGIGSIGEMAFPASHPVSLMLTSDTVMQSFMIGALVGQIYVMPGMLTRLHLKADQTGLFEGENTQYNGAGFSKQKFRAVAMSEQDFNAWIQKVKEKGVPLDNKQYRVIANRSLASEVHALFKSQAMPKDVTYFHSVSPTLFSGIVDKYHSGESITAAKQPGGALYHVPISTLELERKVSQ